MDPKKTSSEQFDPRTHLSYADQVDSDADLVGPEDNPDYYQDYYESSEKRNVKELLYQYRFHLALAFGLLLVLIGVFSLLKHFTEPKKPVRILESTGQVQASNASLPTSPAPSAAIAAGSKAVDERGIDYWNKGMFKIGVDLEPGYYAILSDTPFYFEIASDSSGRFETVLANGNNIRREYVKVQDGQYLKFNEGILYRESEAPTIEFDDKLLPATYSLGVDLAGGEYKIRPIDPKLESLYVVMSDCSHIGNEDVISSATIDSEIYLTVPKVGYLKLVNAELLLP